MNEITNAAPQVVNLLEQGGVTPEQVEHVAQDLVGEYGWFALAALAAILAKDMIINFAQALLVFLYLLSLFWSSSKNSESRYKNHLLLHDR